METVKSEERKCLIGIQMGRVSVAMMAPLKEELRDLEMKSIIEPVEQSTNWVSSMVSVMKPNRKQKTNLY